MPFAEIVRGLNEVIDLHLLSLSSLPLLGWVDTVRKAVAVAVTLIVLAFGAGVGFTLLIADFRDLPQRVERLEGTLHDRIEHLEGTLSETRLHLCEIRQEIRGEPPVVCYRDDPRPGAQMERRP